MIAALLACWEMRRFWRDPTHEILGDGLHYSDQFQTVWFLKWVPWRVAHLHNPFTTDYIYYPHRISLAWNTSTYVLGLLSAPLTFTAGSLFSYGLLMTLGPTLGTLTSFWWLRRHRRHGFSAAVGALSIGFGPYLSGQMLGHLNLVTIALLPIIAMLVEDLAWRHPRSDRRTAVWLGIAAALQAGISEELLLIEAIAIATTVLAGLVWSGRGSRAMLGVQPRQACLAIAVFAVLSAPLLINQLFLSRHVQVDGPQASTFADLVRPHGRPYLTFGMSRAHPLNDSETGLCLGWALALTVFVGVLATWRRHLSVRVSATAGLVFLLLATGDPVLWAVLRIGGSASPLHSVISARFSLPFAFAIAWLVSLWIDQALAARDWRGRAAAAWLAVAVATMLPMPAPAGRVATQPAFFTSARLRQLIPAGSAVLLLPAADQWSAVGMLQQAQSDFRFKQTGGWALHTAPKRAGGSAAPDSALARLAYAANLTPSAPRSAADVRTGIRQLAVEHYRAIVLDDTVTNASTLRELAVALAGANPSYAGSGVTVWLLFTDRATSPGPGPGEVAESPPGHRQSPCSAGNRATVATSNDRTVGRFAANAAMTSPWVTPCPTSTPASWSVTRHNDVKHSPSSRAKPASGIPVMPMTDAPARW